MDALAATLKASPEFFPHSLDLIGEAAAFVRLGRDDLARASFLDARVLTPQSRPEWVPLARVHAAVAEAGLAERCDFIFHIGHVGSTLLSRLLGAHPSVLSLREPQALRTLAQAHADLAEPESLLGGADLERAVAALLRLWSRPFAPGQTAVIKATSFCCEMAEDLLARPSRPRGLLMFVPPAAYLEALLGGPNNRLDIRSMASSRLRRLHRRIGASPWRLHAMSYGEMSAMSWACEMTALNAAAARAPDQTRWLDFERFLLQPQTELAAAFAFLGSPAAEADIAAIAAGPEMGRYSKSPEHAYDAALRGRVQAQARREHGAEIARGLAWLERAATEVPEIAAAVRAAGSP